MKRFFLLLIVLSCFRISYGEELTAEQKQLAWRLIYENLLSDDFQPNTFKSNIILNLKGKITPEDSVVVKDLVSNFQKAIPRLKIELSDKPGDLILGLNYGKNNTKTTNMCGNHTINFNGLYFPLSDSLSNSQRKQFIYYQLIRGLVFYNKAQQDVHGVGGCVFAEKDFNNVTFSPLDLFILEQLYAPDFPVLLAQNLDPGLKQSAWNSIFLKFMGETKKPIVYRNDIVIKLEGTPGPVDSACVNELISDLKTVIPTRKIYFSKENANLIFSFNDDTNGTGTSTSAVLYSILSTKNSFKFSPDISKEGRKKILYHQLYRSLVHFSPSKSGTVGINGCVYDEKNPENVACHPVDAFMLNRLYADDFQEQFKNYFVGHYSYRTYLVQMYHSELDSISLLLGLLITAIFLTRLIVKGVFKTHNWSWKEFNKQGLYVVVTCSIYSLITDLSDLQLNFSFLILLVLLLQSLLAINLIFYTERFILKNRNLGGSKVIIIFLVTLVVMAISFWGSISSMDSGTFIQTSSTSKLSFSYILVISLARSLFIFLNDRYKSIINQKDVELAQMGELHKQAELQSLRAKINPHFLYNALNSIASLATTDARKTEQMALALSDFFKYAINREQKQLNTLSEELNATRTYLEIEKVRFGDRLSFVIDCPPELLDIQIPQLLIQPLVENAIKHGLSQITENGLIRIVVSKEGSQLKIRVYDNGPAFPDGPLSGFGIQNTQERIVLLYGAKATINWQNKPEKYIEISLPA